MKVSLNWLQQYVDLTDYRNRLPELSRILTQAGLEVEDMEDPSRHWDQVVVGHLLEVGRHPNADKLTLCQVDVGSGSPLQIVCGATNHRQGDKVAVAQVGAVLSGDFKIKKSKIRDVESMGMLCSVSELGLADSSEGILILSADLKVGTPLREVSELSDVVFELNVTPNRADCLSHRGLARELCTLLNKTLKEPQVQLQEKGSDLKTQVKVDLQENKACPRYSGRLIRGVRVGESPEWLKARLQSIGLNSINNVVDVTNFVLFEYGQPLHAFDFDQLAGQELRIRMAQAGETFVTLDGTEIRLNNHDLLICDRDRAVALAGVVGGQNSGVSEETQNIFIESAFFRSEGVRRTARAHGIETDSCYRFSRGVDPDQTLAALNRAASLILEVAGGELQKGVIDLYPQPLQHAEIQVTANYIGQRLGYPVSNQELQDCLQALGCQVVEKAGMFLVRPPSFRWDLSIPEDLVEEFARLKGYDKLGETLPKLAGDPTRDVASYELGQRVQDQLVAQGFLQAVNYAFISKGSALKFWGSESGAARFGLNISETPVELINPLSEELAVMRESLLPSLFKNLCHNFHHGVSSGRLFELAPAHLKRPEGFAEENRLALVAWGEATDLWTKAKTNHCLFSLKAQIESLLSSLGAARWRWDQVDFDHCPPGFHPGQSASLFIDGKTVGLLGSLHPELKERQKLRGEIAWAELNLDLLLAHLPRSPKFKGVPKFPGVERDIALVGPEVLAVQDILNEVKKAAGPLLISAEVFDVYQDAKLSEQKRRSVALSMRFQSDQETLTDEVVNGLRDKVVNSVCQKLGLEIR